MTSRRRTRFRCSGCGQTSPVWNGRCGGCQSWNSLVAEEHSGTGTDPNPGQDSGNRPGPLAALGAIGAQPVAVGIDEFDRVLAGGLVPGSATLLSGPPGVGKSTLALQVAAGLARIEGSPTVLYVSAEETIAQIRRRADRLELGLPEHLWVSDDPDVDALASFITRERPAAVVVDSIQAMIDHDVTGGVGSVSQVRSGATRLAAAAHAAGTCLILIGHVTKDGAIAGPRTLEHLVDTVLTFDADLDHGLRFLRAIKHRYGPVGELGVFTMATDGLHGVDDVGAMFLADRLTGVPGSVAAPVLDGRRVLVVELQALVEPAGNATIRLSQGLARRRVELIRIVLEQTLGLAGSVSCSVAGGIEVTEPAVDLAVACAVVSAATGVAVDADTVVLGEVGLVGEVRGVRGVERRIREAARLGFSRAIVPAGTPESADGLGLEIVRVPDVAAAARALPLEVTGSGRTLRRTASDAAPERNRTRHPHRVTLIGTVDRT